MSDKPAPHPAIKGGLSLDGNPDTIRDYYKGWAQNYDEDVSASDYCAPANTVNALLTLPESARLQVNPADFSIEIMDAGCGTGLVGSLLANKGFRHIDGMDLSAEMAEQAGLSNAYRELFGGIDINNALRSEWQKHYDCIVCTGLFTLGHVEPTALNQLIDMTKIGGIIIVSTRAAYYDSSNYQQVSDALESDGKVKLLNVNRDAEYTNDGNAHYWSYVVLV